MSSPAKRHLPDIRFQLSSTHGDKRSALYGSAGDITAHSREGSPDRGQRLYGSTQNLDRRQVEAAGKRKQPGRSMTPDSRYMMDKEVTESQNRKLQMEVSTLQTENKLLKEKNNRFQARISDLEEDLAQAQEDLANLQETLNQEVSDLSTRARHQMDHSRDQMQTKLLAVTKENEALKAEVSSLEKQLDSSHRVTDMARHNSEKSRTLQAQRSEITTLNEELSRVKALLDQSERHLRDEEERYSVASKQVLQLTELKNALQQQSDTGGSGAISDKQIRSLEKRLKVTEERLHQERADRANNLSSVEDKLLTENARLQAVEKEITRQLHREKEKNRNFEHRVKQLREENEKLRLALPFDDVTLTTSKTSYDIPYSSHSQQRAETLKNISDDMNYILSQIEKQDGLQGSAEEDIIRTLWNKRELAYRQLREYEVQCQELQMTDNNIVDGLKNLRDTYGQAESKLKAMEEQVEDARNQLVTMETTYKEQLNMLVKERHDAFARLKTAEDILEAVRTENEMLRTNMAISSPEGQGHVYGSVDRESLESLRVEKTSLEGKIAQLSRTNQLMEGELATVKVQLEARNKALQDVQSELDLAYSRLQGDEADDRKQQKIDKLTSQVNGLQVEIQMLTDKYSNSVSEKSKLESEITSLRKPTGVNKLRQPKTEQVESKVLQQLRDSVSEKDSRIEAQIRQTDELEAQLQKSHQDLYAEQMHTSELEAEVETLQLTVAQRAHMFESLSGSEREQLAQYQVVKETLDNVSQELAQKDAQIISLDVNLSSQKDKTAELEEELERLRSEVGYDEEEGEVSPLQLKVKELQKERTQLKQELSQAYSAIKASEEQYRTLQTEGQQLEQELVKEKTVILQITAEKGEIEQHLEELAEEHDALIQEKNQAEDDLIKLETKLQEILQKYEAEARKQHGNFQQEHPNLPAEARKIVEECDSLKLLLEGKTREVGMLKEKINRQNLEIDFLHRKVELVHNDSIANREDVARMISELTLKMKEAVSTREVNQFLVGERTKLQNEKVHLEKELEMERKNSDQRKKEIDEVVHKMKKSETKSRTSAKTFRDKDDTIATLETELRASKQSLSGLETENAQMKNRLDHLNNDLENLTSINDSLEKRLELEKSSREIEGRNMENSALKEELHHAHMDLETNKGHLLITKDTVQKLTSDQGSREKDYEGMCRSLTEKERQLVELRERSEEKLAQLQREHATERLRLDEERNSANQERDLSRKEMDMLNEQLQQKEIQLSSFGKTLQELETVSRQKRELETMVHNLESSSGDSRLLLEGQRKELMALNESVAKQQEKLARLEAQNHTLQSESKSYKATASQEIQELQLTLKELKSQQENERSYLNDNFAQTQNQLRATEVNLSKALNEKESLKAASLLKEKALEDLQQKYSDESTGRRLAEQSIGSLRLQLEDSKTQKNVAEAQAVEARSQLSRVQEQVTSEQDKNKLLTGKVQELTALSSTSQSSVRAKGEQVETLQKEMGKLKQMLEAQKQSMTGKMKKASLDFKQQMDLMQEEKERLVQQVQQLSTDLDTVRKHMASKNRDNLKLKEDILVLEANVRESAAKEKQAQETLKRETEKQSETSSRFREQDVELRRLRTFLAKKVEESGDTDKSMWHEMNRVIQDLSKQMQNHIDAQSPGKEGRDDTQVIMRYKKQLAEAQGELSTERSLHQITKTSLQALEEDCQRLRHQLHALRRRDPPTAEKKYKSRMEAINAIIARSQTQAQAILASSGYLDDTMLSPRYGTKVGHHSPRPRADSPDNSYSEDLSVASLPPLHYGSPSKKSGH